MSESEGSSCVAHRSMTRDTFSGSFFQHHEMKEVHKASKRAKIFETQKVVKRLKDARHVFVEVHAAASSLTIDIGKNGKMRRLGCWNLS